MKTRDYKENTGKDWRLHFTVLRYNVALSIPLLVSQISKKLHAPVGLMLMSSNTCYLTQCNSSFVLSYWSSGMAGSSASRVWITANNILYLLNNATIPYVEMLMETQFRSGHIRLLLETIGFLPFSIYSLWSIWWNHFFLSYLNAF